MDSTEMTESKNIQINYYKHHLHFSIVIKVQWIFIMKHYTERSQTSERKKAECSQDKFYFLSQT